MKSAQITVFLRNLVFDIHALIIQWRKMVKKVTLFEAQEITMHTDGVIFII